MNSHEFLIIPSKYEGLPFTLIEAIGSGIIPITSNIEVFKFILGEKFEKLASDPMDYREFSKKIISLYKNTEEYICIKKYLRSKQKKVFRKRIFKFIFKNYQ